jgi:hypothetical protein
MTRREPQVTFPDWTVAPHTRDGIADDVYLAWLSENREALRRNGLLEKLRRDPVRCPVDARFSLSRA